MIKVEPNIIWRLQRFGSILKLWNYDDDLLELATLASIRLHNWMLRNRQLNYDPNMNPKNMFRNYW